MTQTKRIRDIILKCLIFLAAICTVGVFLLIAGYTLVQGAGGLTLEFFQNIWPILLNTLMLIGISIGISAPLGICSVIYLNEFAKQGKLVRVIRFATECLAGVPSIVLGLFGLVMFNTALGMGYSMIAGGLTVAIMLLPTIMRTVEEALKTVPDAYRHASFALGATKLRTIVKIVLPASLPGIMTAIILAIGRVVGETAALLFTAGTVEGLAAGITGSGRTLAVHMYLIAKEAISMQEAYATAFILLAVTLLINLLASLVGKLGRQKS